ncbi:hypothetical protein [Micromonospora maritima]|uniref:hypothetical protein n=1 Tax=Micromonospora maritima TaxID=986711 RepID=UPI00157BC41E|nr:hypothetical protein [Micromonospora maritima]
MDGTSNTEQLPEPLAYALDEILTAVNGVDPIERDADYDDCSEQELRIHRELNKLRNLITEIRVRNDIPVVTE